MIEGMPPDLIKMPVGCSFAPRCKYVISKCRTKSPDLMAVNGIHFSACWRIEELPKTSLAASEKEAS